MQSLTIHQGRGATVAAYNMHTKRIISSVLAIPVIYLVILWGGFVFYMLMTAVMISALMEFYSMSEFKKLHSLKWWGLTITLALIVNSYFNTGDNVFGLYKHDVLFMIITVFILGLLIFLLYSDDIKKSVISASITLFGVFYVSWMLLHALLLRELKPYGFHFLLTVLIITWVSDISAYFVGLKFGWKRQLHKVSPNKSRSGALASVIFGGLTMLLMKKIFAFNFFSNHEALLLGAATGFFAVLGDLTESMIKRSLDHKDSGSFLPGHGGVLDRIDSFLFTVPLFYYYIKWFVL